MDERTKGQTNELKSNTCIQNTAILVFFTLLEKRAEPIREWRGWTFMLFCFFLFLIIVSMYPCLDVETDKKGTRDRYCGFRSFVQASFTCGQNVTQQLHCSYRSRYSSGTIFQKKKPLQMGMRVYVARVWPLNKGLIQAFIGDNKHYRISDSRRSLLMWLFCGFFWVD